MKKEIIQIPIHDWHKGGHNNSNKKASCILSEKYLLKTRLRLKQIVVFSSALFNLIISLSSKTPFPKLSYYWRPY